MRSTVPSTLALLSLTTLAVTSHIAQAPLEWSASHNTKYSEDASWNLTEGPAEDATWNFIFNTASSLMQKWGNTRYRNGHTIIPGTIAPGTILTHGTFLNSTPHGPEWTATDPEHSYMFCWGSNKTGCGHATVAATRPLKVLYFDGSSAAKLADGQYDTQDIIRYGAIVTKNWSFSSEYEHIRFFCDWGKPLGFDGFVRMQMDFEVMLCDFTDGVELVSFAKLVPAAPIPTASIPAPTAPAPPGKPPSMPWLPQSIYQITTSGGWHNRFPGDTRVRLDYTRMVSFYDTALVPSLVDVRAGKERWQHRLAGISKEDVRSAVQRLGDVLRDPSPGSGVDWEALIHVVVDRYADRLVLIRHILSSSDVRGAREIATMVQEQLRIMLTPYILNSIHPPNGTADADHTWADPVWKLCAMMHTAQIAKPPLAERLTYSEHLLLRAVGGTSREICRVVTMMWVDGVLRGVDSHFPGDELKEDEVHDLLVNWQDKLTSLMNWLDWNEWVKCRPACSDEEECYLPTWPFFTLGHDPDWQQPKPRCIPKIKPSKQAWP